MKVSATVGSEFWGGLGWVLGLSMADELTDDHWAQRQMTREAANK